MILPFVRKRIIKKRAMDAFWCITSKNKYVLKYAEQSDQQEHKILDLTMPSHTKDLFLHILLKARVSFHRSGAEFPFDGKISGKPVLLYWFHPFVARGHQEKWPDLDHNILTQLITQTII